MTIHHNPPAAATILASTRQNGSIEYGGLPVRVRVFVSILCARVISFPLPLSWEARYAVGCSALRTRLPLWRMTGPVRQLT
jgi:hypothetical protein